MDQVSKWVSIITTHTKLSKDTIKIKNKENNCKNPRERRKKLRLKVKSRGGILIEIVIENHIHIKTDLDPNRMLLPTSRE